MADLAAPDNPFVLGPETSRHFHPLWVGLAAASNTFGWDVWTALMVAALVSMLPFTIAVHGFAQAYFDSPWAPVVLLLVLTLGWILQPEHTGFHSLGTLMYGAFYPATFMISFSLMLWTLVMQSVDRVGCIWRIGPLVALMVCTHQLGAAIGLCGAGALAMFWPGLPLRRRLVILAVMAVRSLPTMAYPYYNPFALILTPGNSTWNGVALYDKPQVVAGLALVTVWGGLWADGAEGTPVSDHGFGVRGDLRAGFLGVQLALRALMPLCLVLQIGVAALILRWLKSWEYRPCFWVCGCCQRLWLRGCAQRRCPRPGGIFCCDGLAALGQSGLSYRAQWVGFGSIPLQTADDSRSKSLWNGL